MWSNPLTPGEVTSIYNSGLSGFDLLTNFGSYISSATLLHWWQMGQNGLDIGEDTGSHSTLIDLTGTNMDVSNRVTDVPPTTFTPQPVSVDFDGTFGDLLQNTTEQPIGIANAWSIAMWWKPDVTAFATVNRLIHWRNAVVGGSQIQVDFRGTAGGDPIQIGIGGTVGGFIKLLEYGNIVTQDAWNFDVITWNGTDLVLYHDGVVAAVTATLVDTTGTMSDAVGRSMTLGASVVGQSPLSANYHSVGAWDTVLGSAEQLELYNAGSGSAVDWSSNGTNYVSRANLVHWYRLGLNSSVIGYDSGLKGPLITLDTAVGINAGDIVADAP
jgi:hypothetical protein